MTISNRIFLFLSSLLVLSCLAACTNVAPERSDQSSKTAQRGQSKNAIESPRQSEAASEGSWQFHSAMDRHRPLAKVQGVWRPDDIPTKNNDEKFAEAIRYAEETGSYALLIWQGGALRLERYFPPYNSDLRADSASMHKSVLGLLIAAAIADGYIESPDNRIGEYISEWNSDKRGDITIRQLLTMSSGLEPLSVVGGYESEAWRYVVDGEAARATTLARPLQNAPGERFHYLSECSQLLIIVVEQAVGRPYADYLSSRIWARLGAQDAYLWLNEPDGFPRGYTALMARARDWLRVGLLVKDRGRNIKGDQIIPKWLVDEATAPSEANENYGWHLWLGTEYQPIRYYNEDRTFGFSSAEPFAVDDMIYFDGIGGQRVYISRSKDLIIVRQGDQRLDWDDTKLPNLVMNAL